MGWLQGLGIGSVALGMMGCLYADPINLPIDMNSAPYFTNYNPKEDTVLIGSERVEFLIVYTDPDEQDLPLLEVAWFLDGQEQGNGNKMYIYPEDLGADGQAVLHVRVTDPAGDDDVLVWTLRADTSIQGG